VVTKNLYLPPDATPERKVAQETYVAASDKCAAYPSDGNLDAYRAAEREFGRVLLAEDKKRRPHIYAEVDEPYLVGIAKDSQTVTVGDQNERLIVAQRATIDALVAALEVAKVTVATGAGPLTAMREIDAALALARK
jgi:hypothetical protein